MIKERRKHPRLRIPLEAEYLVAGRQEWREGTIWTLGAGGAALLCEERLEKGTQLDGLHFVVEKEGDLPETRIEVGAEVVSLDRKSDFGRPNNFMLGLRFTDLSEQEFELLRQFVFRRLTGDRQAPAGPEVVQAETEGATPIEIRFKLFDEFVEEISENLSPSGMFIRARRPLPPGSRFVFQFQLGDDFSLFQGTAEVVWTRRRSEDPDRPPGMGVRFLKLDLTSQRMVRRLVGQSGEVGAEVEDDEGDADGAREKASPPVLKLSQEAEPFAIAAGPPPAEDDGDESLGEAGGELQAELEKRLVRLEERLREARAARDGALDEAAGLRDEAAELRDENRALEAARDEAEEARESARSEAAGLLSELETLRPDGDPDDDVQERLELAHEELERGRREWQEVEAELRADLERRDTVETELRAELEEAGRSVERLREGLEEAGDAAAQLRQRVQRGDETEAELRQRLEQAADTEAELRQRLETTADTEVELRQRLETTVDTEVELRQRLERADEVEAELRESLERVEADSEQLARQTERAEAAESDLDRQGREAAEARREWDALEAELRGELEERIATAAELEERLADSTGAAAELRQRVSELRSARDELEERLARGDEIQEALREQAQELRSSRDSLEAELQLSRARLDRMRDAAEEMRSRFNGDLTAARTLESDLASRLAQFAEFGSSLGEQVESLTTARADLAERLARITGAWSSLEEGLAELEVDAEAEDVPPRQASVSESADEPPRPEDAGEGVPPVAEPEAGGEGEPPVAEPEAGEMLVEEAAEEPPASNGAGGLLGVARRAAARLGFGRKPAAADGPADETVSPLEAKTEPVAEEEGGGEEIEQTVKAWAAAWSEQRVEDYLSFYSHDFEAARQATANDSGEGPHAWLPPLPGMELTLGPISRTEVAPGRFAVRFEQSVETDSYTRRTGRTLEMVREADAWKIAAESFQEL